MSKQAEAKERQQYTPKAIPQTCGNCLHRKFERVNVNAGYMERNPGNALCKPYWQDKDQRCGIGGFAVKKMGACTEWMGISA